MMSGRGHSGACSSPWPPKVEQPGSGRVPPGTVMNGVIKQDRSDHKSAAAGNEEEKTAKEKSASEVRDGTKLQPPPFAERKNADFERQLVRGKVQSRTQSLIHD
ncbi:hypothetical protein TURU_023234 [Turdus rufiventris]|nr:hypothetical protein TURU_023234 [Turdus rufiventris]